MGRRSGRRALDLTRYRGIVPEWERFVSACTRPEPTVVRVRTGRISERELAERLEHKGFRLRPVDGLPSFFRLEHAPHPVSATLEHWSGLIYVQQASTGVAAPALGPNPGERVLDLCAAPGGKTTHLCELMQDRGCVVASEIDERRIRGLLGNVYRLGHTNVLVTTGDGRSFPEGAVFDRVLVDAPCSGEGTLRRRSGEAPDQSKAFLAWVRRVQEQLLVKAVRLTRPGGTILYVTCTFAPEENEAVVSNVLASQPVALEPLRLPVPHAPGITSFEGERFHAGLEGAARIYPHHLDSGGLFLAKLRRLDGEAAPAGSEAEGGGWRPVPAAFPDADLSEEDARARIQGALTRLADRYDIDRVVLDAWRWAARGERIWVHTLEEWPLESWEEDSWRAVALGMRAMELDVHGRPRPTNDFLRLASAHLRRSVVDVTDEALARLARGGAEPARGAAPGPAALRLDGEVVGRGSVTPEGLVSEIPKARAADLLRALGAAPDDRSA